MADCFTSWDAIYAQRRIEGNTEVWWKHNRIKLKQKIMSRKSPNRHKNRSKQKNYSFQRSKRQIYQPFSDKFAMNDLDIFL